MPTRDPIPPAWQEVLRPLLPVLETLSDFLDAESAAGREVYPARDQIFAALAATPPEQVCAVILGQDPYHGPGQAHGLAFSVPEGTPFPPSLRNIFKERTQDLGLPPPDSGDLTRWARQGVLLLNTVLTVRAGEPGSHRAQGWELVTDAVIGRLGAAERGRVFLLWGGPAQAKVGLIDSTLHTVLPAAHPSPLSAWRGFFGSRPFSRANQALVAAGRAPVTW